MTTQLNIEGYNTATVTTLRKSDKVEILSGYISKAKGKKAHSVTVQIFANGVVKVFTIESLKNIEHKTFNLN